MNFAPLLSAATEETQSWFSRLAIADQFAAQPAWLKVPVVLVVVFVLPFLLGWLWAKWLRMPNYSWRLGLILCTISASIVTIILGWPPKLGVDLKGGYIMIWQIENDPTQVNTRPAGRRSLDRDDTSDRAALIETLKRRLNPDGLKEISIRPYGLNEVEIIVPETDKNEIEKLKRQVQEQGVMEFLIVAERGQDATLFEKAQEMAKDPVRRRQRSVIEGEREIGRWVKVGREERAAANTDIRPLRLSGGWSSLLVRNADTGELLPNPGVIPGGEYPAAEYLKEQGITDVEVLAKVHDKYRVLGDDLRHGGLGMGMDESGRPSVLFAFNAGESANNMGGLTQANIGRQLAIVLDDVLLSAANIQSQISDSGRITGQFTEEEVNFIIRILKAGSLPAKLKREPVYEEPSDPTLGAENIRQGAIAIAVSLIVVFIFCLGYYRYAGVVASIALVLNILLTVGVMILFGATLTMPGLAGLVLTIGMAVDSNVLIFERMREEIDKGASLRMAIRNGFDRAMTTIIDSNLTTLLTAIILYVIGTDQLVGFAVTLTLGLIISMFTAIFVARVIFEIWERTGFIRTLSFLHFFTNSSFDFVRYMGISVAISCILIAIGLGAAIYRGAGMFDIDLRGGSSVQVALTEPLSTSEVRQMLETQFADEKYEGSKVDVALKPVGLSSEGEMHSSYRIDTIIPDTDVVQDLILKALVRDGKSLLKHYQLSYQLAGDTAAGDESSFFKAEKRVISEEDTAAPADTEAEDKSAAETPADEKPSTTSDQTPAEDSEKPAVKSDADERPTDEERKTPAAGDEKPGDKGGDSEFDPEKPMSDETAPAEGRVTATVRFADSEGTPELVDQPAVLERVREAAKAAGEDKVIVEVGHPEWDGDPTTRLAAWNVSFETSEGEAEQILSRLKETVAMEPVWPASKKIGGQIAGDFVKIAVAALLASLVGIVAYIWFRFQNVTWGFAAVLALVHDVLFMLGGIAVSYFLVKAIPDGTLGLTEFKIDLTVIAAFLTLIGYSINDTIVIFDRMREVKGKLPNINRRIVNDSVNQTLSRSILTFLTVFLVVVILYAFGGPGIHGFAYAMLIGTVVGMYSTVFIAAPFLLWMLERNPPIKKPL